LRAFGREPEGRFDPEGAGVKKALLMAVALIALAVPATAQAAKIRHTGEVLNSPYSDNKVTLRVTKKAGEIKKISGFKASGVRVRCANGTRALSFWIDGFIRVNAENSFKVRLPNKDRPKEKLRITGRVKKGGKKVVGNFKTNSFGRNCDVPKQRFVTKKA
jgi:hypothetical protein